MARLKVKVSRYDAFSEALVVLSVVGFFVAALVIAFGGNAVAELRNGLGTRPAIVAGVSTTRTATPAPAPTPAVVSPSQTLPFRIGTPVPVLATIDAIMTSHAERSTDSISTPTTPVSILQLSVSPTRGQSTSTAEASGTQLVSSSTATKSATATPTIASPTATRSATATATIATPTVTVQVTATPTIATPTVTVQVTATPTIASPTPTGTATPNITAPVLVGSSNGTGAIVLSWTEAGQLGPNDYFDVRVWQDGQPAYGIANVQQTSYTIGGDFPGGSYNWTIAVIHKQGGQIITLAQAATTLHFIWSPAGSGGGGPPIR